ncbi:MAG TPA: hypothetical protein VNT02_06795 [Burkholderiales bacterium]|nr:hypothetical protein [Burkholderiales bacterium]
MRRGTARWASGLAFTLAAVNAHAAVTIYDATQLSYDRYRVVKRLWVDSWRTAIGVPHEPTREAAVQALVDAAESAGADGLINVYCVGGTPSLSDYYCYGNAIKVKSTP